MDLAAKDKEKKEAAPKKVSAPDKVDPDKAALEKAVKEGKVYSLQAMFWDDPTGFYLGKPKTLHTTYWPIGVAPEVGVWAEGVDHCNKMNHAGVGHWRLPTMGEWNALGQATFGGKDFTDGTVYPGDPDLVKTLGYEWGPYWSGDVVENKGLGGQKNDPNAGDKLVWGFGLNDMAHEDGIGITGMVGVLDPEKLKLMVLCVH